MGAGEADHGGWQEARRGYPENSTTRHNAKRRRPDIGLRDSEMMKLADAILAKEVSIKGNKLPGV